MQTHEAITEAIAQADAHLNNAALPTYSELLAALETIRSTLEDHPQVFEGNSKVHYVYHLARRALAWRVK